MLAKKGASSGDTVGGIALFIENKLKMNEKIIPAQSVIEANTGEQLQDNAFKIIAQVLNCQEEEIQNIAALKAGMTNRSFKFECRGKKYIMRIPGKGTKQLVDRQQECAVYNTIRPLGLSDELFYIDPKSGYKLSGFLENARTCNPQNVKEVSACMQKLRQFHSEKLKVAHTFDLFHKIEFYESLWGTHTLAYKEYEKTRQNVFSLRQYIEDQPKQWTLTHIDAVPDNFLFVPEDGHETIKLIDWEYAGMQDACVDVAMFAIYALYERKQIDQLIDLYYPEGCEKAIRCKIYCYIAVGGLLWSNWCEYKRQLGMEFGEYALRQYQYAKEYVAVFKGEM